MKRFLNYEFKILHVKFPRYTVRRISAKIKVRKQNSNLANPKAYDNYFLKF